MPQIVPLDTPVVIPPVPEKVYDAVWVRELLIRTLDPTAQVPGGTCIIKIEPMSSTTFEVLPDAAFEISTEELMLAAATVPEVAAAIDAILAAVPALKTWIESR
jgi:hypothetical protein